MYTKYSQVCILKIALQQKCEYEKDALQRTDLSCLAGEDNVLQCCEVIASVKLLTNSSRAPSIRQLKTTPSIAMLFSHRKTTLFAPGPFALQIYCLHPITAHNLSKLFRKRFQRGTNSVRYISSSGPKVKLLETS